MRPPISRRSSANVASPSAPLPRALAARARRRRGRVLGGGWRAAAVRDRVAPGATPPRAADCLRQQDGSRRCFLRARAGAAAGQAARATVGAGRAAGQRERLQRLGRSGR
ncbi:hypothetical protein G6F22_018148 [Rhizopus arrhizus]|nr:hypothetical protein G6F22_018148 [Rhizopus arrhizus]